MKLQLLLIVALIQLLLPALSTQQAQTQAQVQAQALSQTYDCSGIESYTCASYNGICTMSWETDPINCEIADGVGCCPYGLVCSDSQCVTNNNGTYCRTDSDCQTGVPGQSLVCNTYQGACTYTAQVGDSCDGGQICATGLNCINGICTGASLGFTCGFNIACDLGLYCSNLGTCQSLLGLGSSCSGDGECVYGTSCVLGTCQLPYSVPNGGACSQIKDCNPGYYCKFGVCTSSPDTDDFSYCSESSDCDAGSLCLCSKFTGLSNCYPIVDFNNYCSEEYADVYNCQYESTSSSISSNPGSQFIENCSSDWNSLQDCQCSSSLSVLGACFYNEECYLSIWAILGIVFGVIILCCCCCCIAIAVSFFFCFGKRKGYDAV